MNARGLVAEEIEALRFDPVFQCEGLTFNACVQIRRAMRNKGITQEELAQRLGISQPAVAKYLNHNHNLTLGTLARISSALGLEWSIKLEEQAAEGSAAERSAATKRRSVAVPKPAA